MHVLRGPLVVLGLTAALGTTPGIALADSSHGPSGGAPRSGQDPRGNNGTVKISGIPVDGSNRNQPHVGCSFALTFFGFDQNQTADITFTGQAPTKTGTLLSQHAVPISDDPAGGGKDADAVLTYSAQQLGLSAVAPAKQGWHVKVAVEVLQAPGGAKQKVFWISCPSSGAAPNGGATSATPGGGTASTPDSDTTSTAQGGAATSTTPDGTSSTTPGSAAGGGGVTSNGFTGGSGTVSLGVPHTPGRGQSAASGSATAAASARPAALPFTGFDLRSTLAVGAATAVMGAAALALGRRRRVSA